MHLIRTIDCQTGRVMTCCGLVGTLLQDKAHCIMAHGGEFNAVEDRDERVDCPKCLKRE